MEEYTLGVAIPVYHGDDTVGAVVDGLYRYAGERRLRCRVALVADGGGARDNEAVRALAARYGGVTAVILPENVGQQKALYYGIRQLDNCALIATMDDDGAHPAGILDVLMEKIRQGADLCYAVPARRGGSAFRRLGALCRDALFSLWLGMPKGVRVGAYRVMTRQLALRLAPEPDGFLYLSAAAMRLKPVVDCVRYEAEPAVRTSRYTRRNLLRLYRGLLLHYTPLSRLLRKNVRETPCGPTVEEGRGALWEP